MYSGGPGEARKAAERLTKDTTKLDTVRDRLAQAQQVVVSEVGNLIAEIRSAEKKIEAMYTPDSVLRAEAVKMAMQRRPKIGGASIGVQKHPPAKNLLKERPVPDGVPKLDGPMLRVLGALTWFADLGIHHPSTTAVAFMSKYSGENGAFNNVRGKLRTLGLVTYPAPGTMAITGEGMAHAPKSGMPATGEALRETVLDVLDGPQQRVLRPALAAYPEVILVPDLAAASGYGSVNGAFNNVRGRLRTLGLLTYPTPGSVRAADILFPD